MNSWADLIYQDWRIACGQTAPFKRQDYHQILSAGSHSLREGEGQLTLTLQRDTFSLQFEEIRRELDSSKTLLNAGLTMRCDYVLCDDVNLLLAELTSGITLQNLSKKTDRNTGLTKFEKVQEQLYTTYATLRRAASVEARMERCTQKVAVCSYTLLQDVHQAQAAFSRPLHADTCANGVIYPSPRLNAAGIEYRRIAYHKASPNPAVFTLS